MRVIGDIHGKLKEYETLLNCPSSVQIGDYGIGFINNHINKQNHNFIRGNHDNPALCKKEDSYIEDGTYRDGILYAGGATSIDKHRRIEGVSWWQDEELDIESLLKIKKSYEINKPKIMISHECPDFVADYICKKRKFIKFNDISNTRNIFNSMMTIHEPELWIFGHWHYDLDVILGGTRFICLNELSYIDIDINNTRNGTIIPWSKNEYNW